jgi:general stress protein CsbA
MVPLDDIRYLLNDRLNYYLLVTNPLRHSIVWLWNASITTEYGSTRFIIFVDYI